MQLNLVHGWRDLEAGVGEKLLKVFYRKVGYTNVLDATRLGKLLELGPCVEEIPIRVVLLEIIGVGR